MFKPSWPRINKSVAMCIKGGPDAASIRPVHVPPVNRVNQPTLENA